MTQSSLRKKTLRGTIWSTIEKFSMQIVVFLVTVVMARELGPKAFGVVTMVMVFVDVAQGLVDFGFSQALIRKLDRTQTDCTTMFYFNVAVAVLLYGVMCACAHPIAEFYHQPELEMLTPVVSLILIINSFIVVQKSLLSINLDFRTQAKASFGAAVIGGIVGIIMVFSGCGLWSIVGFQLAQSAANCVLIWIFTTWRPTWEFSMASFKELGGFGSRIAIAGLISTVYNNGYQLVIGRVFNAADLGYYGRAHQFGSLLSSNISNIIQRVSYPVLCSIQDEREALFNAYRKFLRIAVFVVFPLMIGMAAVAYPLVEVILGKEWLFAATLLQIMCLSMMWLPVHSINLNLLQVKGKGNLFLRLEIIKRLIGVAIIIATVPFGIIVMTWGMVANSLISLFINTYYSEALIGLGFWRQMREYLPSIFYSFSMGAVVMLVQIPFSVSWLKLGVGVIVGVSYFIAITYITSSQDLRELMSLFKIKNPSRQ